MQSNRSTKNQYIAQLKPKRHPNFFKCSRCGGEFNKFRREISWRRHVYKACPFLNSALNITELDSEKDPIETSDAGMVMDDMDTFMSPSVDPMDVDEDNEEEEIEDKDEKEKVVNDMEFEEAEEESNVDDGEFEVPQQVIVRNEGSPCQPLVIKVDDSKVNSDFKKQVQFFTFAKSHGISRNTTDGIAKLVNNMLLDRGEKELLPSHYRIRQRLMKSLPFQGYTYKACVDGCRCFPDGVVKPCLMKNTKNTYLKYSSKVDAI